MPESDFGVAVEYTILRTGVPVQNRLAAVWELPHDPISDDWLPEEISAEDLLARWVKIMERDYPSGILPIYWYIGGNVHFESLPLNVFNNSDADFDKFYSRPVHLEGPRAGEALLWTEVPVRDKLWLPSDELPEHAWSKGGFIQSATGWKPSILQPVVLLDHLLGRSPVRGVDLLRDAVKHSASRP